MIHKSLMLSLFSFVCVSTVTASEQSPRLYTKGQLLSIRYLSRGRMIPQAAIERAIKVPHAPHVCDEACGGCCRPQVTVSKKNPQAPHVCTGRCTHPGCQMVSRS